MDRRTKLYIVGILSLGYAAVGLGIVKSIYQIAFSMEKDKTLYVTLSIRVLRRLRVLTFLKRTKHSILGVVSYPLTRTSFITVPNIFLYVRYH